MERRSGPEHRLAHRPSTLPWAPGSTVRRDGPGAFLLDLHNFPDLSKADISRQNPNIQVTVCVCVSGNTCRFDDFCGSCDMATQARRTGRANRKQENSLVHIITPFFLSLSLSRAPPPAVSFHTFWLTELRVGVAQTDTSRAMHKR